MKSIVQWAAEAAGFVCVVYRERLAVVVPSGIDGGFGDFVGAIFEHADRSALVDDLAGEVRCLRVIDIGTALTHGAPVEGLGWSLAFFPDHKLAVPCGGCGADIPHGDRSCADCVGLLPPVVST